jgi:hypothetical protein
MMMTRHYVRVVIGTSVAAMLVLAFGDSRFVGAQQASRAPGRSLEGDWVRTDPNGSGNFGGLTSTFTPAVLSTEGAALMASGRQGGGARGRDFTDNRVHKVGDPYIVVDRPCAGGFGGALGVNPDSGAIHIIEQKDEVIIAPERGGSRHIYMDGRVHPDLARWVPSVSGHAVGHYENGALVVDTVGFAQGAVTAGGFRTPETHLNERFDVSADGRKLTITYTWNDPKIYQKPHSYQYVLDRLPAGSYALDDWCDASDPVEQQSIVPPKQLE